MFGMTEAVSSGAPISAHRSASCCAVQPRCFRSSLTRLAHSGDRALARHVANAVLKADSRGTRIYKQHRHSTRRIDLTVAALMAFDRPRGSPVAPPP